MTETNSETSPATPRRRRKKRTEDDPSFWWRSLDLAAGRAHLWRIGPLSLCLEHRPGEWRLSSQRGDDPRDPTLELRESDCDSSDELFSAPGTRWERTLTAEEGTRVEVQPLLADRLLVSYPEGTNRIAGGSRTTLYVSMPLWLRLSVKRDGVLFDQSISAVSDSWLGDSTLSGELCYAIRVHPSLQIDEHEVLPYRAITRVRVVNRSEEPFDLVRLVLPAPNLSLYRDRARPQTGLWTSSVTLERTAEQENVGVEINKRPPRDLEAPELISQPRSPLTRNILARALSAILH